MAKIYISYSNIDTEIAKSISSGLKELGHQISIDIESLTAGQEWRSTLAEALKASDVLVSLISQNSARSQFVMTELGSALAYSQTSQRMLVIPVILGSVEIPDVVRNIHVLFAREMDAEDIVRKIDHSISVFLGKRIAEKEQEVEVKNRIESNAAIYIDDAIKSLADLESRNRRNGNLWYLLGYLSLVLVIGFGFYSLAQFAITQDQQLIRFAYAGLKSVVVIGLLIACSKYAFTLGKSYMNESLKSADRIHAISFGRFYLRAFSDKADWTELKEVFQHWNIDKNSVFSSLDTNQFDPKFIESAIEIAKIISAKIDLKK